MHIWTINKWEKNLKDINGRRTGLRLIIDKNVDNDISTACKSFTKWLRREYSFPLRVPVYIKGTRYVKTMDGDLVVGSFFEPDDFSVEPYIRLATGDYAELLDSEGKDNAIASILLSLAHELTHYFQWINGLELTPIGRERQATLYSHYIIDEYSETCEHP